ncbi:MAG: hypothetical protein Q9181_006879 [Wetmoreana brouardii]
MHLLHTKTLKLRQVSGRAVERYATLSHTWGDEEVSFQDIQKPECKQLKGYEKIRRSCSKAASRKSEHIRIDTCCIDKSSSAELSEAINSMYEWYSTSKLCLAYLSDFRLGTQGTVNKEALRQSKWFYRGWTLQELLAPLLVAFYDCDWNYIGDKYTLTAQVSFTTGIPELYIRHRRQVLKASVAARMSWAAHRETTRPEDEAYCLMGLFDVNLPLLYGEGRKAFRRLQYSIIEHTNDESIFAWHTASPQSDIFAPSAAAFARTGDVVPASSTDHERSPYTVTNRGLCIVAYCHELKEEFLETVPQGLGEDSVNRFFLLPLFCAHRTRPELPFSIILMRKNFDTFLRLFPSEDRAFAQYVEERATYVHGTIYIAEPTENFIHRGHPSEPGFSPTRVDMPHDVQVWYVTPPGYAKEVPAISEFGMRLNFVGGPGFAVLSRGYPSKIQACIILRQIQTATGEYAVTMYLHDQKPTVAEIVNACHTQYDSLNHIVIEDPSSSLYGPNVAISSI